MLAFFAAATVVLAAGPMAQAVPDLRDSTLHRLFDTPSRDPRCKPAGRLQTSMVEPTLLYREQDRAAGRARRLIDLPKGQMCLLDADASGRKLEQ